HIYRWDEWAAKTVPVPMITGHEYAGEIVALGRDVTNLSVGQRVSGEGHVVGMKSRASRAGKYHLDPDTKGIGVNLPGAFAEYVKIPALIPLWLLMGALLVGGVTRSFFFTGVNALVFADVDE